MRFDVFFSISQTPVEGVLPSETQMFRSFFRQVTAADTLGYDVAWVAESHLSSDVQKYGSAPVIPHWQGEVGLNVDITQLAHHIFKRTRRIEVGSAITNILCNGGPVAAAERVAYFATLHGQNPQEVRRLHFGFAAGRFDYMNRASGIVPRGELEQALGPVLKSKTLREAAEILMRLWRGDVLQSEDIAEPTVSRADVRDDTHWKRIIQANGGTHGRDVETIPLQRRWSFERLKIVPQAWRRELVVPLIGSHDPALQTFVNGLFPVRVFNLSITAPQIIEETHARMQAVYHKDGGPWQRQYMPRTVLVFVDASASESPAAQRKAAQARASKALRAYWTALEGTLDPERVRDATDNALVGNPDDVAGQIMERFHRDDRLMLWFDFFEHDCDRVIDSMRVFQQAVVPRVREALGDAP